jgi:hypothetical protein
MSISFPVEEVSEQQLWDHGEKEKQNEVGWSDLEGELCNYSSVLCHGLHHHGTY